MSALLAAPEEEHIAFRVEALDAAYKAMNEAYIEPISYSLNNVFLVDWDAEHWGQLDFYDILSNFIRNVIRKNVHTKGARICRLEWNIRFHRMNSKM